MATRHGLVERDYERGEYERDELRARKWDRMAERIAAAQAERDARPRAIVTEADGRIWITANGQREHLHSEAHAVKRIAELVADGWRIHDPHDYLRIWASFDDAASVRELDADAAGYPDTPLPAVGTPMGDALMSEEEFLRAFERELF